MDETAQLAPGNCVAVSLPREQWTRIAEIAHSLCKARLVGSASDEALVLRLMAAIYGGLDRAVDAAIAEVAARALEEDWAVNGVPDD